MEEMLFYVCDILSVETGDTDRSLAEVASRAAGQLTPKAMAEQTKYISYGPANKDAAPEIDPAVLPDLPSAPDNLKTVFYPNPEFWGDKGDELRERFNAWLAQ